MDTADTFRRSLAWPPTAFVEITSVHLTRMPPGVRPGEAGTNQAVQLRAVRVVLGGEAFFEKLERMLGAGGVVDDGDEEPLEVDLDAGEQLGNWVAVSSQ